MLMFQNGLLATFIPELLMVFAYLFCFVAPGFKSEKHTSELTPKVIHVAGNHTFTASVYKVTKHDFRPGYQAVIPDSKVYSFSKSHPQIVLTEHYFRTSSGHNLLHFSRPPPAI